MENAKNVDLWYRCAYCSLRLNRLLIIELVKPDVFISHSLLVILAQRLLQSIANSYDDLRSSFQKNYYLLLFFSTGKSLKTIKCNGVVIFHYSVQSKVSSNNKKLLDFLLQSQQLILRARVSHCISSIYARELFTWKNFHLSHYFRLFFSVSLNWSPSWRGYVPIL